MLPQNTKKICPSVVHLLVPLLIPKMRGERPLTQIIVAKFIKASFFLKKLHVYRLLPLM